MGLDLKCGSLLVPFGPYGLVQEVRRDWVKAFLRFLKKYYPNESRLISQFEICISKSREHVDYQIFETIKTKNIYFCGLRHFVLHSDSDGKWTSDESMWILLTWTAIKPFMSSSALTKLPSSFEDLLQQSILSKKPIFFK
jgi:hypothetical protein